VSAADEQRKAAQAYTAGRERRDKAAVQRGQDNARIDGAATGAQAGGAR
jgi:hypothetical protein